VLTVIHPRISEGWCGKPKGLLQILHERGWIDPAVPLRKYKKVGTKGKDFEENGDLKDEIKPFVLTYLLNQCPDFANETSDLQHLAVALSDETCVVTLEFTPKYHCEMAGEGVEFGWGFSKKLQRRLPLKDRRKIDGFIKSVKHCLLKVTPVRMRRFARRARKYMLAYHEIGLGPSSRDMVDAIVDIYYTAPSSSTMSKRKRNTLSRKRDLIYAEQQAAEANNEEEPSIGASVIDLYQARGAKCRIVSIPDQEEEQRDRLARSNEDVNATSQMRQMLVHRSMMDTDTAHINNEVELAALEGGLTME
jgi:hypothetical protein